VYRRFDEQAYEAASSACSTVDCRLPGVALQIKRPEVFYLKHTASNEKPICDVYGQDHTVQRTMCLCDVSENRPNRSNFQCLIVALPFTTEAKISALVTEAVIR